VFLSRAPSWQSSAAEVSGRPVKTVIVKANAGALARCAGASLAGRSGAVCDVGGSFLSVVLAGDDR
jgi:hypothetical protein